MANRLEGKVAIVTGGSEGIGKGIAKALVDNGAKVYLLARTEKKLVQAKKDTGATGYRAGVDITDFNGERSYGVGRAIEDILREEGRLDIFVNNAGGWKMSTYEDSTDEALDEVTELDFIAPRRITRYLLNKFAGTDKELVILNMLSQAVFEDMDGGEAYGTAKAALWKFMRQARQSLERNGIGNIKLYGTMPGTVDTENTHEAIILRKLENPQSLESVTSLVVDQITGNTLPHLDVMVRYRPDGKGIRREYIDPNPSLPIQNIEVVDRKYQPPKAKQ